MLEAVDSAKVTTNLWGERWSKLVANAMANGVSAITGWSNRKVAEEKGSRRLCIRLAGEAIRVGLALGYELEPIRKIAVPKLLAAAEGEGQSLEEVEKIIVEYAQRRTEAGRPSTAQDILKGRRTEIDFINGLVVRKGGEIGLPTPANEAVTAIVKRMERGELKPGPENIANL
jgi:2-dehydropantoate 2-reductase